MPPTHANTYFRGLCSLLGSMQATRADGGTLTVNEAAEIVEKQVMSARRRARKVMLVGNGGSAAVVAHAHNDLCKAAGVRAMLFTEPALLTAHSNDESFDLAYARQVEQWADRGDVLIAVSSSGQSRNIITAAEVARDADASIVTLTGFRPDNPLRRFGDVNFYSPSESYGHVELSHAVLLHYLTDAVAAQSQTIDENETLEANYEIKVDPTSAGYRRRGLRRRRASA